MGLRIGAETHLKYIRSGLTHVVLSVQSNTKETYVTPHEIKSSKMSTNTIDHSPSDGPLFFFAGLDAIKSILIILLN